MKRPENVKELCEFIWYLEDKYNLLDFEISGVKSWQAHRIEIYYSIGKELGVFEKGLKRGMNKLEKLKSLKELIKNSIFHNPLIGLTKKDILVFTHPRSKKINNEYKDIYTYKFIEDIQNKNIRFLEFEKHFNGKHIRKFHKNKRYLDFMNIVRNIYPFKISLNESQEEVLNSLKEELKILNINYDIRNVLVNRVKKFLLTYKLYKIILSKTKPKEIYIVVSYGRAELIKAAKDLNIKTIEFQHGTFSKYHLGYSYPNYKGKLDYFPDEFWVWNDYWKNLIDFPIIKENVKIYPFRYLEELKKKYKYDKILNQLVVLGQGGLTDRMANKILENYEFFKDKKIIFKLHPEEYGRSHMYKNLNNLLKIHKDIKVVEDVDLYELLSKSKYQAGVFSTALYEGIEFGCKTILFNLPGIEYMDKFIKIYKGIII